MGDVRLALAGRTMTCEDAARLVDASDLSEVRVEIAVSVRGLCVDADERWVDVLDVLRGLEQSRTCARLGAFPKVDVARDAAVANRLAETEQQTSEKEKEGKGAEVVEDGGVEGGEVENAEVENAEVEGARTPNRPRWTSLIWTWARLVFARCRCTTAWSAPTRNISRRSSRRAKPPPRLPGARFEIFACAGFESARPPPPRAPPRTFARAIRAAAAGADGFVDGSDGGSNGRGCAIHAQDQPSSSSSDFVVEFDLFGHDVWRRGGVGVAPIRGESARLAYLDRREARLAADRDRHLHPHWLLAESESSRSSSSDSDWNPRASAWCPTDRLGALAVSASAASDFFSDATTSYEKDWERHAREIVAMDRMNRMDRKDRGTEKGLKNPTPVPLREAWRLVVEDAWRDSVAALESEISRRREVVDVAARASETVAETRRKIDARRADPRLADARAADPPDERRVETLEFELAESIAPLEVALNAAVAEEKIAKAEAAVAAAEAADARRDSRASQDGTGPGTYRARGGGGGGVGGAMRRRRVRSPRDRRLLRSHAGMRGGRNDARGRRRRER